ncbi:Elp4 protein [Paramicrosporidium saccamoebae]|uniref:Elongator complex protein 4 n=1 Tax=Paramicrosporidium saccamoebae TaxID=1246581 RepID=A0A2H9TL61_9FUNG|nr:Elp4 protein [Paramicrosporidium saccamoebae]
MSFVRRTTSTGLDKCPRGCRTTASDVVVTGTGVPSFDKLFLNGLPVGSVIAIREDWPRSSSNYSSCLLKCICAEALSAGQHLLYIDETECDTFLSALPAPGKCEEQGEAVQDEKMTIAWRYKHLRSFDDAPAAKVQDRVFDLGKKMDAVELAKGTVVTATTLDLEKVEKLLHAAKKENTVLKVVLRSFASPLYLPGECARLLYQLRQLAALHPSNVIIFLTIPAYTFSSNSTELADIESQCDLVIDIQSFVGTPQERIRALNEYNGFLRIVKPLRVPGSLALAIPETNDLAFKVKKRQLYFEAFHLPPDSDVSTPQTVSTTGCNSMETNKLDF